MSDTKCKIAIAGTHSTGKSTLMAGLKSELEALGYNVGYVHDRAETARDLGFPILEHHTFESTSWLIAEAIRLEMEATLHHDVVLVDRPVPDALGYLLAALRHTGRLLAPGRFERLHSICREWTAEYDLILVTKLDPTIPLGEGRDQNASFRAAAAEAIDELLAELAPRPVHVEPGREADAIAAALSIVASRLSDIRTGAGTPPN